MSVLWAVTLVRQSTTLRSESHILLSWNASTGESQLLFCLLSNSCTHAAAGEQWQGQPGAEEDSYTWAQVDVPTTHGAVVQIAAGTPSEAHCI